MCTVSKCNLSYIPDYLHWKGRPIISSFYLNEELYWRTLPNANDLPYASISLTDVSHNRQGPISSVISFCSDVLYNTDEQKDVTKLDYDVTILAIKELLPDNTFSKKINQGDVSVTMCLEHDPIPCNYAHTIFKFFFQDKIHVTFQNYEKTLGDKKNKDIKKIRTQCRLEIQAMIIRKELRINLC